MPSSLIIQETASNEVQNTYAGSEAFEVQPAWMSGLFEDIATFNVRRQSSIGSLDPSGSMELIYVEIQKMAYFPAVKKSPAGFRTIC